MKFQNIAWSRNSVFQKSISQIFVVNKIIQLVSVIIQGGLCFPTTVFPSHENIYQNMFKIFVGSVLWPLIGKCVKQWENSRDSLRRIHQSFPEAPYTGTGGAASPCLEQEAEIIRKGRTRVKTITKTFCKDVSHGEVQTLCSKECRKVRVSKESKLQTLGREKRRTRREKVMEAERALLHLTK